MRKRHHIDPTELYLSAVTNADGSVNTGYLVLFRMLSMLWTILGIITVMAAAALWSAYPDSTDMVEVLRAYAIACGVVAGSMFGAGLTSCGVFLWGDSHQPSAPPRPAPMLMPPEAPPPCPPPKGDPHVAID